MNDQESERSNIGEERHVNAGEIQDQTRAMFLVLLILTSITAVSLILLPR